MNSWECLYVVITPKYPDNIKISSLKISMNSLLNWVIFLSFYERILIVPNDRKADTASAYRTRPKGWHSTDKNSNKVQKTFTATSRKLFFGLRALYNDILLSFLLFLQRFSSRFITYAVLKIVSPWIPLPMADISIKTMIFVVKETRCGNINGLLSLWAKIGMFQLSLSERFLIVFWLFDKIIPLRRCHSYRNSFYLASFSCTEYLGFSGFFSVTKYP